MSNHRRMLDTIELLIHAKNNERGIIWAWKMTPPVRIWLSSGIDN
jgi:hypothetical protein